MERDRCKLRNSYTTMRKGPPQGDHLEELETREEGEEEIRSLLESIVSP